MAAVSFASGQEYCNTISVFFGAQSCSTKLPFRCACAGSLGIPNSKKGCRECWSNSEQSLQRMEKCRRSRGRWNHIRVPFMAGPTARVSKRDGNISDRFSDLWNNTIRMNSAKVGCENYYLRPQTTPTTHSHEKLFKTKVSTMAGIFGIRRSPEEVMENNIIFQGSSDTANTTVACTTNKKKTI